MENNEAGPMIIRQPVVAGHFYAGTKEKLEEQIKSITSTTEAHPEPVIGVITPHAGYDICGKVIADTFRKVETPDVYILLGPKHGEKTGPISIFPRGVWNTPLGEVTVNQRLVQEIKSMVQNTSEDPHSHEQEHSLEVQLPCMQYYAKKSFTIVPILLPTRINIPMCEEFSKALVRTIHTYDQKVVIVATTDLSQDLTQEMANRKDQKVIHDIAHMEIEDLSKGIKRFGLSYCGMNAVMSMILAAKELGATSAELIKYLTTGDLSGDYSQVNGYAGMLVK